MNAKPSPEHAEGLSIDTRIAAHRTAPPNRQTITIQETRIPVVRSLCHRRQILNWYQTWQNTKPSMQRMQPHATTAHRAIMARAFKSSYAVEVMACPCCAGKRLVCGDCGAVVPDFTSSKFYAERKRSRATLKVDYDNGRNPLNVRRIRSVLRPTVGGRRQSAGSFGYAEGKGITPPCVSAARDRARQIAAVGLALNSSGHTPLAPTSSISLSSIVTRRTGKTGSSSATVILNSSQPAKEGQVITMSDKLKHSPAHVVNELWKHASELVTPPQLAIVIVNDADGICAFRHNCATSLADLAAALREIADHMESGNVYTGTPPTGQIGKS